MMRMCEKCLNNCWTYKFIDGWIRATCKYCGEEVEFESLKEKKQRIRAEKEAEKKV